MNTDTEKPSAGNRLFSLDLLRGIDMFYLAVVSAILTPLFTAVGADPSWQAFFCSHPWEGFTLYDIIMPLFIFMCGAAVPFALRSRLDAEGRPTAAFHRHVWSRTALLWVLGMLAQGNLTTLNIHNISPYSNTLQTIAVGYVATAYVLLIRSWTVKIAIPVVLTLVYGLVVHFGGDYTKDGNVTMGVELAILNSFLPKDNTSTAGIVKYGYTWFLPSLMFPVIALCGAFSTEILRQKCGEWKRAGQLFAFGGASLAVGWILAFAGVKMVKHIFTVSFTLQAIGWSILALAVLFVVSDIWKLRRGTGLLILFGQCALTAYLCESVFRGVCFAASDRLFSGVQAFFSAPWAPVVRAVGYGLVVIALVWCRSRMKKSR